MVVEVKRQNLYMLIFLAMSVVYGAFSSSSPDNVGVAEIFIGFCLLVLVGIKNPVQLFDISRNYKSNTVEVPIYVRLSFIYLLTVPSVYGVVWMQNDIGNWVRDFIPLIYAFIPVLMIHIVRSHPEKWLRVIIFSLCVIGFLFCVRFFMGAGVDISTIGSRLIISDNRDNTMQDPATQFFLAFSTCVGFYLLLKGKKSQGVSFILISFLPWAVMFASVMRAPVVLTGLSLIILLFCWLLIDGNKRKAFFPAVVFVVAIAVYGKEIVSVLEGAINLLLLKQAEHGLSSRDLEVKVVISQINTIETLLFGMGWGGLIDSPFGGQYRFVHNMIIYFVFKVGLIGTLAFAIYFTWLLGLLFNAFRKNSVLVLLMVSLIPPLFIAMVLEPMFKSLSFGIVLLIIPLFLMIKEDLNFKRWFV